MMRKSSLRHHSRRSSDKDIPVGLNAGGDHRRPSHRLALKEGEVARCRNTPVLLEIMGQGGVGSAGGRLLGNKGSRGRQDHIRNSRS